MPEITLKIGAYGRHRLNTYTLIQCFLSVIACVKLTKMTEEITLVLEVLMKNHT
jgi:hypothetical protein